MVKSCHSAYIHKNMIMQEHYSNHHCGHFGSIFTTHHCCGGFGFGGTFGGGLGAGLGLGLSQLLMSGLGYLGNWAMGGLNFGGGFGNWGGGFGNFGFGNTGFWGLNGTNGKVKKEKTTKTDNSDNSKKTKTVEKVKENADAEKLTELDTKLTTLLEKIRNNQTVSQSEIDELETEINAIDVKAFDDIQDDIDKKNLENLKNLLPELKQTIESNLAEILKKEEPTEDDIRSLIINFATLTEAQKTELKTKVEDKVKDLKNKNGTYIPARNNYSQWLYLELLGKFNPSLVVNVENYDDAGDKWIKGRPYGVEKDAKGNVSYWIDCAETGGRIRACWKFVTIDENTVKIIGTEATDATCDKYNARIGMEYDWDKTKKCYINNNEKYTAN